MNSRFPRSLSVSIFLAFLLTIAPLPNAKGEDFVSVSSKVSSDYVRTALPDGTFEPETYTFKNGGYLSGRVADDTIDKMTFASVSHVISSSLANRKYFPALDPKAAKLLIVLFWGTTRAPAETAAATPNGQRMERNGPDTSSQTALPGYDAFKDNWMLTQARAEAYGNAAITTQDAMMLGYDSASDPDLRHYRYFVVLLAYNMQAFLREKKEKLLWQTRFSMDQHRNQFDVQLKPMALKASEYFGRDSLGLRHDSVPEGHVEIGVVKSLGVVLTPNTSAALAPDGIHVAYFNFSGNNLELGIGDIGQQRFFSAGEIPNYAGQPPQLAWFDSTCIVVRLPSSEVLAFDTNGKRIDFDTRHIDPGFEGFSRHGAEAGAAETIQAIVEEKLPDRKIAIIGADKAQQRFLLIASDNIGTSRRFVYDRSSDLLYEIGRSVSTP